MNSQKTKTDAELLKMVIKEKKDNPKTKNAEVVKKVGISNNKLRWVLRVMKFEQAKKAVLSGNSSLKQAYLSYENVAGESAETGEEAKPALLHDGEVKLTDAPKLDEFSNIDCSNLETLEAIVKDIGKEPILAGFAISKIIEDDKFTQKSKTFKDYCKAFLPFSYRRAMQLAEAFGVYQKMNESSLQGTKPTREWHIRPLIKLKNIDYQVAAWEKALEKSPDGRITEKEISNAVNCVITEKKLSIHPKKNSQKTKPEFHNFQIDSLLILIEEANKLGKSALPVAE